jgi:hypothetical protein
VLVYFVNLATGEFHTFPSTTVGAHIAYDALKEAVVTMRALRGTRVMPMVNLSERPFKTGFGMRRQPHFEIVGWRTPGDDTKAVPIKPVTPQLSGPVAAPAETLPAPAAASPSALAPINGPTQPHQAKPKPLVNLTAETLATMGDVKPVTASEILDDELPW